MQTKVTVEIDRRLRAAIRFWNRDVRPHVIVRGFAKRHDDIQAINRATLKDRNQRLALASLVETFGERPFQKRWRGCHYAKRCQRDAARFKKKSSIHCSFLAVSGL